MTLKTLPLPALILIVLFNQACTDRPCRTVVVEKHPSPTGKRVLVSHYDDCGAVGGTSPGLSIIDSGKPLPASPNFIQKSLGMRLEKWESDSVLEFRIQSDVDPDFVDDALAKFIIINREYGYKMKYKFSSCERTDLGIIFHPNWSQKLQQLNGNRLILKSEEILKESPDHRYFSFKKASPTRISKRTEKYQLDEIRWDFGEAIGGQACIE